jgi:amino acid adenylation domain-containing protein
MLGRLLRDGGAQVTVLPFNIQDLLELYPPAAGMPFFAEVGGRESHVSRLYARPRLRQAYVAPRDEIERQLAELWKQTLRIDRVGIHDSFFELGGDSVLAAQVVTLAQRTFGVQLDLREAFQGFTIEHLARQLAPALTSRSTPAPEAAGAPIEVSLSFVQERQLFLELLEPMTAVNNLATCLRLDGRLDPASLQRSADVILQRHQVLRSAFTLDQGRSVVRIVPSLRVGLKVVEVEDGPDRMARLQRVANREAGTPFDVTVPPLLRFTLFRLSATEHVLLIVIHHAIADGWSLGVFLRELFTLYHGGKLAPLAMQYADHAARQRRSISDPRMLEQLTFWREALGGELMALDLPIDHARLPRQTFSGGAHRLHLESPLTARLKELGRVHDATLFMVLLAAFKAVLHRYTGQQDLVVGTPTAGRMAADTTDLIGPFINTLVLRTDLSGDPGFGELLDRVRAVALAAYAYQEVPFERLVIELNPARDLSRTPLFQVLFILQNTPWPDVDVPGLKVSRVPVHRGVAAFDLTLEATEGGGGLDAVFEYNRDLFEPETVARLAASWELLLQDAAAHPERRLSELATMSAGDRDLLVTTLNRTEADYPGDCCVHQLFESSVERVPGNLAVQCGGDTVSYEVLEAWANRIAHDLRGLGVGPEVVVAAQLPRSVALVASLLGVLKAAGAYLAIDPDCPADRLEFILHDAGARLLITGEPGAPEGVPRFTDLGRPEGSDVPRWHRAGPPSPDGLTARNLAYLIYTSGSTGQPKGVEVEHRSLVNLLWSLRQVAGIGDGDTLLAVTSVGFDIAALELFLPLITGATVALAPPGMSRDGRALAAALAEPGVRVMQATPATWQLLIRDGWKGQPGLVALSGGEALPPALADQLLDRVAVLWNVYGPTETTVWSTAGRVERGQALISVGRPLANTRLYLLDAERRLVPFGVAGELAIAGDGVARGYRNRPALTARRFVPESVNPAATAGRMFLTGDVARYLPDGSLQVLGRLDDQVKVNGCRIEPDEIAAALCRHPAVHQAAVVAHEAPGGDRVLVAYHVPTGSSPEESGRLRDFLRATLPAYMVPARYVPLARLPLTPSGKVDRRALPLPGPDIGDAPEHPRSPLEEQLAALYTAALGLERVGVDDNFFDLGGGSLQIIEIVARGRDLGLALIPELFFEHQTIAALASHFEAVAAEEPVAGAHA